MLHLKRKEQEMEGIITKSMVQSNGKFDITSYKVLAAYARSGITLYFELLQIRIRMSSSEESLAEQILDVNGVVEDTS